MNNDGNYCIYQLKFLLYIYTIKSFFHTSGDSEHSVTDICWSRPQLGFRAAIASKPENSSKIVFTQSKSSTLRLCDLLFLRVKKLTETQLRNGAIHFLLQLFCFSQEDHGASLQLTLGGTVEHLERIHTDAGRTCRHAT